MAKEIKEDVIGKKFGLLTIVSIRRGKGKAISRSICDCGNKHEGVLDSIKRGLTTSCGCLGEKNLFQQKDITNNKFSRLVAIKSTGEKTRNGHYIWKCICDCGTSCEIAIDLLTSGKTESCGCLADEGRRVNQELAIKKYSEINLREGTSLIKISSNKLPANNTSGHKGVTWSKSRKKWESQIYFKGKNYNLGRYEDIDDAIRARKKAEEKFFKPIIDKYGKGGSKMKNEKIFVGGYYDDRIFKGDYFDGKTPFSKDVGIYTLEEVLKLGFCDEENIQDYYENNNDKSWEDATEEQKIQAILNYTEDDEIAGLIKVESTEEAEKLQGEIIEEVEEIEKLVEYEGKTQDSYGNFRETYTLKEKF